MADDSRSIPTVIAPLKRIRIESFRGIRDQTIELHPEVTVFFGPNATGKTTVLDAIAIGLGAIVDWAGKDGGASFGRNDIHRSWVPVVSQPTIFGEEDDGYFDRSMGLLDPRAGTLITREQAFACVWLECANFRWDVTKLRSRVGRTSGESVGMEEARRFLDPLIDVIHEGDELTIQQHREFPMFAAYGPERAVVDVPLRDRDFNSDFHRLDALEGCLSTSTRFKRVFEWFVEEQSYEEFLRWNHGVPNSSLDWVRQAVERAELRCTNPRILHKPIRMMVDYRIDGCVPQTLDITSLSDGYRTHFAMVVDIARRMVQLNPTNDLDAPDRGTNSEAIILIDEIDLHLDPVWQGRVIEGLQKAFPRAQFIVTTHSEQVIASVPAECVRKLVVEDDQFAVKRVPIAQGSTSERILVDLMGALQRVPGKVTEKLDRYLELVDSGHGEGKEALELRSQLDRDIQGDTQLFHADLEIKRQKIMARFSEKNT
ncbi:MAG: AAA family ATPase [Polyangiaceae bacterium]|nr:AAA family ATPase [Polyangiaceae bacterium]